MTDIATRMRRSPAGLIGDILLWVASIGGVICILLVIATVVFHVTLIMFKTGSMEPTIPTGSLAVVHEIPASQIEVGEIVTVDRPGQLPITHRVTSVAGSGDTRTITLRGDANPTDDVAPYLVSTVREVWTWVPGWAQVVVWFSNPLVLGGLTVGATALVTWAFWPRDAAHGRRRAARRRRGGTATTTIGSTLAVAGLVATLVLGASPDAAQAAEVETVIHGTYLTLTSISDPVLTSAMTTGNPVTWQVGVDSAPPDPGLVHLGVAGVAPLPSPGDFTLQVDACSVRWVAGVCAGASSAWLPATDLVPAITPTTSFGAREVGSMNATAQRWLLMTITMTTASQAQPAQLRLWAWGVGSPLAASPGALASTGASASMLLPPAALGGIAIAAGLLLAALAARRRGEVEDD